jgi:hypothetical protein
VASTVLYMSISLDGFVAGPNEESGKGSVTAGTACTNGTGDRVATALHVFGADLINGTSVRRTYQQRPEDAASKHPTHL